jgi:hypothetical protein
MRNCGIGMGVDAPLVAMRTQNTKTPPRLSGVKTHPIVKRGEACRFANAT